MMMLASYLKVCKRVLCSYYQPSAQLRSGTPVRYIWHVPDSPWEHNFDGEYCAHSPTL